MIWIVVRMLAWLAHDLLGLASILIAMVSSIHEFIHTLEAT